MRVIGIAINKDAKDPFPFNGGDRILERAFLHEIDAVKFVQGTRWPGGVTHMILLRIDKRNPKVIAVLGARK